MERNYTLLMGLFLLLVAVDFTCSDPKGNVNGEAGSDQTGDGKVDPVNGLEKDISNDKSKSTLKRQSGSNEGENLPKDGNESGTEAKGEVDGEENGENVGKGLEGSNVDATSKTAAENDGGNVDKGQEVTNVELKGKTNGQQEDGNVHKEDNSENKGKISSEKGDNVQKDDEETNIEDKGKINDDKKGISGNSLDRKDVTEEKNNVQDLVPPPPPPPTTTTTATTTTTMDGIHVEECDPSNMCMDKNKKFAACLRVPGDDFPYLSLLIQNKGKEPLIIKISAPAFVHLEETEVTLEDKKDRKVKVSIKDSGPENLIVLKAGSGECSLDFKDFMVHNSAKAYVNILSKTPTTVFIFAVAMLILASRWVCLSFKRRSGLKYQRLDAVLPVSTRAKTEPHDNDGWDNSWGDNWDDEEAPMTPSMPLTPRLSSKGLASRRLSKEGWKD